MRIRLLSAIPVSGAIVVLSCIAHAQQGASSLNPWTLGVEETLIKSCASADPGSAEEYREQARAFTQGLPEDVIEAARKSPEYQSGKSYSSGLLSQLPHDVLLKACRDYLASVGAQDNKNDKDSHPKDHDGDHDNHQ